MKRCVFALTLLASVAFAQQGTHVALELGSATVWLGMDKTAAQKAIEAAGIEFPEPDSDGSVIAVDTRAKRIYSLQFFRNKLVYADRNWDRRDGDRLPSVIEALTSLVDQGATNCKLEHAPITKPDMKMDRVFIECGERSVLLVTGGSKDISADSITERIGSFR